MARYKRGGAVWILSYFVRTSGSKIINEMGKGSRNSGARVMRPRILFISGRIEDARRLSRMLQAIPLAMEPVGTLQLARTKLQQENYDVILTEAELTDRRWLNLLDLARDVQRDTERSGTN